MKPPRSQHGFTIVELLIVIVIIGILAGLVVTTFVNIQQRARDTRNIDAIAKLDKSFQAYFVDNTMLPTSTQLADTTWLATSSIKESLLKDAAGTSFSGINGGTSQYVNLLLLPVLTLNGEIDAPCAAILQVRKEAGGTLQNRYINLCDVPNDFDSTPLNSCPGFFTYAGVGALNFTQNATTGFCEVGPSSIW